MKNRALAGVLCALLLAAPGVWAVDEVPLTKHETVWIEGLEQEVLFTYLPSSLGYSLWYDAEHFRVDPASDDRGSDRIVPVSYDAVDGIEMIVSQSQEATVDTAAQALRKTLEIADFTIEEVDMSEVFSGLSAVGFSGVRGSVRRMGYCIASEDKVLVVTLDYPAAAAEGFGSRMIEMVKTIRIPQELIWPIEP